MASQAQGWCGARAQDPTARSRRPPGVGADSEVHGGGLLQDRGPPAAPDGQNSPLGPLLFGQL